MKLKVKVRLHNGAFMPKINANGDWIDLCTTQDISFSKTIANRLKRNTKEEGRIVEFDSKLLDFGLSFELPKGFSLYIVPRSSLYKKYGIILSNSMGIIDNSYNGDNDIIKFGAIALKGSFIPAGTRIAQFEIRPNQFATPLQKIKWLFSNGIKFIKVESLDNTDRGGIGSTGN